MKTIIISDLHNRVSWIEDFISSIKYDSVIFLGDYFDDFNDTKEDIFLTTKWLKQSLKFPNRIHLFGTHDMYYRFPFNRHLLASGNTPEKSEIINSILTPKDWSKLKFYHFEQDFLLTHAGLHPSFVKGEDISFSFEILIKEALTEIEEGEISPILDAGFSRGGTQSYGGITWLDWNDEFDPVPNLNQIVGHTTFISSQTKHTENSLNFNIDTKNKHIGILENGKFSYIENNFL